jgi:hypothetical protein
MALWATVLTALTIVYLANGSTSTFLLIILIVASWGTYPVLVVMAVIGQIGVGFLFGPSSTATQVVGAGILFLLWFALVLAQMALIHGTIRLVRRKTSGRT